MNIKKLFFIDTRFKESIIPTVMKSKYGSGETMKKEVVTGSNRKLKTRKYENNTNTTFVTP